MSLGGCFPLAPSFDHAGPLARSVGECVAMMRALMPELEVGTVDSPQDIRVATAWTEHAEPLVRRRVEEAAAFFPDTRRLDFPFLAGPAHQFMREVAEVHSGLYPDHEELYGDDLRQKLDQCFAVSDAEADASRRARERYREQAADALAPFDLLVVPTLAFVAPPVQAELEIRDAMIRFTYPFNALGWPSLALPCGPAEDGLQASLQVVGRPGSDALVLAAGAWLERALRG
jgi:Asp-tRNA(Asn)/Glu-tRNA(Gln) amidotransferase A subunit family amidase